MLATIGYVLRRTTIIIRNRGRLHIPVHSRIAKNTSFYTNNGTIIVGKGFVTSNNTAFSALDGGRMTIGERVFVNRNCIFVCRENIEIGNHCSFGPNVCIYDHDHKFGRSGITQGYKYGAVTIKDHCWIGANVTILRGSCIGEGCVIGAGCLIKQDIPPHSIVTMNGRIRIREILDEQMENNDW